jgi:hypothetical protein
MTNGVPIPLQTERLRRATSRFGIARTLAFGSLGLLVIHSAVSIPIPLATLFFPGVSLAMTAYGASLLHSSLSCPRCLARTRLDRPWVCGFCTFEHMTRHVLFGHTFVGTCARPKCGRKQLSFICWNCGEPMLLEKETSMYDQGKAGYHPDYPPPPPKEQVTMPDRPPKPIDAHLR